jgi:hypothetical protein
VLSLTADARAAAKILPLKLVEMKPTGKAGDIVTTHHVKYDENPAQVEYIEVTSRARLQFPCTTSSTLRELLRYR